MKIILLASLVFISTLTITGMERPPSPEATAQFPKELNGHLAPLLYHGITRAAQASPSLKAAINAPEMMLETLTWTAKKARYLAHAVDLAERLQKSTPVLPVMQDPQITTWIAKTKDQLEDGTKMHELHVLQDENLEKFNALLQKRNIDLNHLHPTDQATALSLKIFKNTPMSARIARMLLAAGASTEKSIDSITPLSWAIHYKKLPLVKLLLESGATPKPNLLAGTTSEIRALLTQAIQKYENVASRGTFNTLFPYTPGSNFRHAMAYGLVTTAAIDISFAGIINRPSIMLATLQWFLKRARYATHILGIAERFELETDSLPVMKHKQIIDWKTQIRARLEGGSELIHAAASNDSSTVENLLGNKNLDLNWQGRLGSTALMEAIVRKHTKVVQLLTEAGANPDLQDIAGNTPLHIAAAQGDTETCKCLLDAQANLDAQNEDGRTPLMESVANNHAEVSKLLIDAGATFNMKDKSGKNAVEIALSCGNEEAAMALDILHSNKRLQVTLTKLEQSIKNNFADA